MQLFQWSLCTILGERVYLNPGMPCCVGLAVPLAKCTCIVNLTHFTKALSNFFILSFDFFSNLKSISCIIAIVPTSLRLQVELIRGLGQESGNFKTEVV